MEITSAVDGGVGRIVLNRPKALNALTLPMVRTLRDLLLAWRDTDLTAVVIASSDPRAFCAGGDVRALRQNTLAGRHGEIDGFFAVEYEVNALLASSPHPVVALIDGVCMGGGLGLSVHGQFRVVTPHAVLAMPETAIGFFPDIGASYFLPRLPGAVGMYLGLTGARLDAAGALEVGLATHFCPSVADIPALLRTRGDRSVDEVLRGVATMPPVTTLPRRLIDWCFGAPTLPEIRARLAGASGPAGASDWARTTLATLDRMAPSSLARTFALLTHGKQRTLAQCLSAEREAAREVVRGPDFAEGVRAVLVDKDHNPRWQ